MMEDMEGSFTKRNVTGEHKIPSVPETEVSKEDIERWQSMDPEKIVYFKFPEFSGKPRAELFARILSEPEAYIEKYELPGIDFEDYLLQNPDKSPGYMREIRDQRYFFVKPKSAGRGIYLSYLSWDNKSSRYRRSLDVPDQFVWDHTKDRVVFLAK